MKKLKFFIILVLTFFLCIHLFGEEDTKKDIENRKVASGSSSLAKKQIPNYQERQFEFADSIYYHKGMVDSIDGATTGMGGYGTTKEIDSNTLFIEDIKNPGFPIGWITNSSRPIIKTNNLGKTYLEILGFDVYLGKLIETPGKRDIEIFFNYSSNDNLDLEIKEYNETNEIISSLGEGIPQADNSIDYSLKIHLQNRTSKVLFLLKNNTNDLFVINDFNVVEEL